MEKIPFTTSFAVPGVKARGPEYHKVKGQGFGASGLGFRVLGVFRTFSVQGLGLRVHCWDLGFRVGI